MSRQNNNRISTHGVLFLRILKHTRVHVSLSEYFLMSIILATGSHVYYLNILIMKIVCNPDTVQRILWREKKKRRY